MTQNWPYFPHQRLPPFEADPILSTATAAASAQDHSSWVDDFLDFSAARRGTHRRSASDSVAFLEECRNPNPMAPSFDRLDDDQLMSMFSDDVPVAVPPSASSSTPSTPSDQNSNNDDKPALMDHHHHQQQQQQHPKPEPGEVDSPCKSDPQLPAHPSAALPTAAAAADSAIDPKRIKRILANRQSAQRSRVRKLQYISELERSVTTLQSEVAALSPRVAFLDHQRLILNVDNSALKQRIAALAQDKIFKDAHQEALKKEIERLRQVYHQQNLKKLGSATTTTNAPPPQLPNSDSMGCREEDRLLN